MILTCREWQTLPTVDHRFTEPNLQQFQIHAERSAKRLKLNRNAILARTSDGLKAGQVVGVLSTPNHTLEILPKIDDEDENVRKALVRMINVAKDLKVADGELAALDTQRYDLLEIATQLFATKLAAQVHRGLSRRYVNYREDLRLLRGKLNVARQLTHLTVRPDILACSFDNLSVDTPLNRIFKAVILRLSSNTKSIKNYRLLRELETRFDKVSDAADPHSLLKLVHFDRTNATYRNLFNLARVFLDDMWQSTKSGPTQGFSLLFPMNDLFEKYIGNSLKRVLRPQGKKVFLQQQKHSALIQEEKSLFGLRPDAVIRSQQNTIILDTKWKRLEPNADQMGISISDIYQILVYAQAYESKRVILLYPWHKDLEKSNSIHRRWRATSSDILVDIATVDVGNLSSVPNTLDNIVKNNFCV